MSLYRLLLNKLDARRIYRNSKPHCEIMLSRHNLYPQMGGGHLPEFGEKSNLDLILWLLFLCDGKVDLSTIAHQLKVSEPILINIADQLVDKGMLEIV